MFTYQFFFDVYAGERLEQRNARGSLHQFGSHQDALNAVIHFNVFYNPAGLRESRPMSGGVGREYQPTICPPRMREGFGRGTMVILVGAELVNPTQDQEGDAS